MKKIAIIGCGGFAKVIKEVIESLNEYRFKGFIGKEKSDQTEYCEINLCNLRKNNITHLANGVANLCYPWIEEMIIKYCREGFFFPKILHSSSVVSKSSEVGDGTIILENAVVKSYSFVGKFCIINSLAVVSHDCKLDDYVHISLGSKLGGNCKVGKNSFLGINSSVLQGTNIGKNVIIGAGSVVINDIPDNVVAVGNPARIIRKLEHNKGN